MSNTRPALLFQKDNPNLCKNDVNAGQFPGKRHLHEPENSAEVPGCRKPQRNTAPLAAGASRRVATASALSPRAAAAHPAAGQDLRTPERRPPSEEPTSKRRCCLLSPAADPQGAARTPPPLPAGISLDVPGQRDPPGRPRVPGAACPAWPPSGRCCGAGPGSPLSQPHWALPQRRRGGASPGPPARRRGGAEAAALPRRGSALAATPPLLPVPGSGTGRGHKRRQPPASPPRPPRLRSALLPGPETLLGRCFPPPSPVPDARVSTFKKQNNYAFYTEKSQEVHILQIFV